ASPVPTGTPTACPRGRARRRESATCESSNAPSPSVLETDLADDRPLDDVAEDVLLDVLVQQVRHLHHRRHPPCIHFTPKLPLTIVNASVNPWYGLVSTSLQNALPAYCTAPLPRNRAPSKFTPTLKRLGGGSASSSDGNGVALSITVGSAWYE